jgi:hypothetical protein
VDRDPITSHHASSVQASFNTLQIQEDPSTRSTSWKLKLTRNCPFPQPSCRNLKSLLLAISAPRRVRVQCLDVAFALSMVLDIRAISRFSENWPSLFPGQGLIEILRVSAWIRCFNSKSSHCCWLVWKSQICRPTIGSLLSWQQVYVMRKRLNSASVDLEIKSCS